MGTVKFIGTVESGQGHFTMRMRAYPDVFNRAVGEELFIGTFNIGIQNGIDVREDMRINGSEIGEPEQDIIIERCQMSDIHGEKMIQVYRFRPMTQDGNGGRGIDHPEFACAVGLRDRFGVTDGDQVIVYYDRD